MSTDKIDRVKNNPSLDGIDDSILLLNHPDNAINVIQLNKCLAFLRELKKIDEDIDVELLDWDELLGMYYEAANSLKDSPIEKQIIELLSGYNQLASNISNFCVGIGTIAKDIPSMENVTHFETAEFESFFDWIKKKQLPLLFVPGAKYGNRNCSNYSYELIHFLYKIFKGESIDLNRAVSALILLVFYMLYNLLKKRYESDRNLGGLPSIKKDGLEDAKVMALQLVLGVKCSELDHLDELPISIYSIELAISRLQRAIEMRTNEKSKIEILHNSLLELTRSTLNADILNILVMNHPDKRNNFNGIIQKLSQLIKGKESDISSNTDYLNKYIQLKDAKVEDEIKTTKKLREIFGGIAEEIAQGIIEYQTRIEKREAKKEEEEREAKEEEERKKKRKRAASTWDPEDSTIYKGQSSTGSRPESNTGSGSRLRSKTGSGSRSEPNDVFSGISSANPYHGTDPLKTIDPGYFNLGDGD